MAVAYACERCGQRSSAPGRCDDDGVELAPTDDPLIGAECSRYRLVRLLGRGGMGRVYHAIQPAIRSRVAIKLLSEDCADRPALVARFFDEARAVNLIHHEHIVDILDLDRLPSGRPFIVMEYVDGRTLRELIDAGPAPVMAAVATAIDVLGALAAAHDAGVIHRDLKPDNVMVTGAGHTKILDFGIAKLVGDGASQRTATGVALGTPYYMAPEQIVGGELDARADIYAMGLLLHELLTGARPFERASDFEVMDAQLRAVPAPVRTLRDDVPEAVERVILRALAKRPAERFAGAREMAAALREATTQLATASWPRASAEASAPVVRPGPETARTVADSPVARRTPVAAPTATRDGGPRWPRLAGLVAAVIGIAVVAAVIAGGDRRDDRTVATTPPGPTAAPPPALPPRIDALAPALDAAVAQPVDAATPDAARNAIATPRTLAPTGKACATDTDCPSFRCACTGGTSRSASLFANCEHGRCLIPAVSCTRACPGFGGAWNGHYVVSQPTSTADCASAPNCTRDHACVARRGVTSAAEIGGALECVTGCRAMTACRVFGRCSDGSGGECVVTSQAECTGSQECTDDGYCSLVDGSCAIASDADCARNPVCKTAGQCTFASGSCIADSDAECARVACVSFGGCVARDGRCRPRDAHDCERSSLCRDAGFCAFVGGNCAVTQASCEASDNCVQFGACTARRGECQR